MSAVHTPVSRLFAVGCILAVITMASSVAAADEDPDCTDQIEQVPRGGSTVYVQKPWLTYSGHLAYSTVAQVEPEDVHIEQDGQPVESIELETMEADSHFGVRVGQLEPGGVQWQVGDTEPSRFLVDEDPQLDDTPPRMRDGEVEVSLDLNVDEDFPVVYRQWSLSFPSGEDELTELHDLRYLLEFTPEQHDEPTDVILVTPPIDQSTEAQIELELGGRADRCNHTEPAVPVTETLEVAVRAVDLSGNVAEEPAVGSFEGVEDYKLAEAHAEANEIVERIEAESDEEQTTEEMLEEDQEADEESCGSCNSTGGMWTAVVLLGLWGLRRPL